MIPHSPEQPRLEPQGFSFLEYDKAREKIPESTRASVDAWRDEILMICQAHGVDHPSKLVLTETHADMETLGRVQKLLDDILYVFEHQDLPPEKKENFIDDRERVIPLDHPDADFLSVSALIRVYNQKGRFYLLDNLSVPSPRLYNPEGTITSLPTTNTYEEFVYLGPHLVLIAIKENELNPEFFFTDLEGKLLDPFYPFTSWRMTGDHVTALYNESKQTFYPVAEDGTIHEDKPFDAKERMESHIIAGHLYFLITVAGLWKIHTAEKKVIGDPRRYAEKPFLCEKDGLLTIVAKRRGDDDWLIYNAQGEPLQEINTSFEIKKAMVIHETYFFAALNEEGEECLLNEEGTVIWKGDSVSEKIVELISHDSALMFLTQTPMPGDDPDDVEETYYDEQGKMIITYPGNSPGVTPVSVGGSYAHVRINEDDGYDICHLSFPKINLGTFKKIYTMQPIDAFRFYVIGLEQVDETYQVAKRVYDVRKIKALTKESL